MCFGLDKPAASYIPLTASHIAARSTSSIGLHDIALSIQR
jgi:hypothetical protein